MRRAALTSGKTIVTGEHPSESADDPVFLYVDQGHKKGNVVITAE